MVHVAVLCIPVGNSPALLSLDLSTSKLVIGASKSAEIGRETNRGPCG